MTPDEIADMRSRLDAYPDGDTISHLLDEIERLNAVLDEAIQAADAAVAVGWQLVRIPEADDILEEDDPQCSCTHPHHHTGRCANDADNGGLCLPCIHGCTP